MRVVVFGATGGVGRHVVTYATERGHDVTAVARQSPPADAVRWITADVRDTGKVAEAVMGNDAVLWCVGVTRRSGGDVGRRALPGLVDVMDAAEVSRFVGISGAGADLPGDTKGLGARFISALTHRLGGDVVTDKEEEHRILAASRLEWTQVRPPRLTDSAGNGRYYFTERAPGLRARPVAKGDVARAMLDLIEQPRWIAAAPFLVAADGPPRDMPS